MKLMLLILVSYFILGTGPVYAAKMGIEQIELGKVIDINGQQFVKVRHDPVKGAQFMALLPPSRCTWALSSGTMQAWNGCGVLATPVGMNFTQGPCLTDARDGKTYEIRKFSDGKCWMVDNLKYGGFPDACANKTSFSGNGFFGPSDFFGAGTYGDCRGNPGSPTYGYLYNWQAAMQNERACASVSYQPTHPTLGICPTGWHIPTSGASGEFQALHAAAGLPETGFWGVNWRGALSGRSDNYGYLLRQGGFGGYWSSTQNNLSYAYVLFFANDAVLTADLGDKGYGMAVRCIKN